MAFQHIYFNDQIQYGRKLRSALTKLKEGYAERDEVIAIMTMMIDGDGSNSTQFTEVASRFGFTDNAQAKAAWDELNSFASKDTDSSVTMAKTARIQAINKLA
jgi:hypothetical protein